MQKSPKPHAAAVVVVSIAALMCSACSDRPITAVRQAGAFTTGGSWPATRGWKAADLFTDPQVVALCDAIAANDVARMKELIADGADVNARGKEGIPLLVWAMAKDSVTGFEALLENGADLKAQITDPPFTRNNERTKQVIELVVAAHNSEFLRTALSHGFDPDYVPNPEMNQSLLFRSVWTHAINNAAILLDAGADINHVDVNQDTPLILAQDICYYEMVSFLLTRGADPGIKTRGGYDLAALMKRYGDRGVTVEEAPHFRKVVAELKKRGLITDEDIEGANLSK